MFESFEVRRVANGFVLVVHDQEGETREYVYDTARKLMRVLKQHLAVRDGESD